MGLAQKTIYYRHLTDDVVVNQHQDYKLPADYRYLRSSAYQRGQRAFQLLVRAVTAPIVAWGMHVHFANRDLLAPYRHQAKYIYANHTAPVGDALKPFQVACDLAVLVAPSNLKLPILGHFLPLGGVIPIPGHLHQYRDFLAAIKATITANRTLFIYPEAHVWPFATMIRPFEPGAFRYPVQQPAPVFSMTTTYQRTPWHCRPKATVFFDGPFYPDASLPAKAQQQQLQAQVQAAMEQRVLASTYTYINYQPTTNTKGVSHD